MQGLAESTERRILRSVDSAFLESFLDYGFSAQWWPLTGESRGVCIFAPITGILKIFQKWYFSCSDIGALKHFIGMSDKDLGISDSLTHSLSLLSLSLSLSLSLL